jgi:hypothetical protein
VVPGVVKKCIDFRTPKYCLQNTIIFSLKHQNNVSKTPGTTNPLAQHNIPEEDLNFQ